MPDRAVVEERWKAASKNYYFDPTQENREALQAAEDEYRALPRALVAISDDRRMMVALDPHPVEREGERLVWWTVFCWDDTSWEEEGCEPDTGQDANQVLGSWLNDQELAEVERQEREHPGFA